jgi:hypothetical protein
MAAFAFAAQAVSVSIPPSTWRGASGEIVSGVEVAAHLRAVRNLMELADWEPTFDRGLQAAFRAARANGVGDLDTQFIGRDLMEQILRLHLSGWSDVDVWTGKPHRSRGEVLDLLASAADLADSYGPAKAVR